MLHRSRFQPVKLKGIIGRQPSQSEPVPLGPLSQWKPIDICAKGAERVNALLGRKVGWSCGGLIKCEHVNFTFSRGLAQEVVVALQWSPLGGIRQIVTDPKDPHSLIRSLRLSKLGKV